MKFLIMLLWLSSLYCVLDATQHKLTTEQIIEKAKKEERELNKTDELFHKLLNPAYRSEILRILMHNDHINQELEKGSNDPNYIDSIDFDKTVKKLAIKINENRRADPWRKWCLYTAMGGFAIFTSGMLLFTGLGL